MRDFIVDFEDLAEELGWFVLGGFEFVAEELIAFYLVFVSLIGEFVRLILCLILVA